MPTNKGLFFSSVFDLPRSREKKDLYISIKETYERFLVQTKQFDGLLQDKLKGFYAIIEKECDLILGAVKFYLLGQTSQAFLNIKECLDTLEKEGLLEIQSPVSTSLHKNFFRIRTASNDNLVRKELFHIPFELREKVATQRYSIPGLPCLYFADSIYVAWEELGRPDFDTIHVSRFDLSNSNFKLLHLNVTTKEMRERCFKKTEPSHVNQLVKFISYFPLLAACSFTVEKKNETFKPEYIIPQLLLQWVTSTAKVDGIQYKSNRLKTSNHNIGSFSNLAVPVKTYAEKGYCEELSKKIKLTAPLSWSLLQLSDPANAFKNKKKDEDIDVGLISKAYHIEIIENEKTDYITSKFGILEEKLRTMPVELIT